MNGLREATARDQGVSMWAMRNYREPSASQLGYFVLNSKKENVMERRNPQRMTAVVRWRIYLAGQSSDTVKRNGDYFFCVGLGGES